jgi:hypothetical protein
MAGTFENAITLDVRHSRRGAADLIIQERCRLNFIVSVDSLRDGDTEFITGHHRI